MKSKLARFVSIGALLLLGGIAAAQAGNTTPTVIDVKGGAAMQSSGALLLDVREPQEYAQGHAPGSVLIPLGELDQRLAEISQYKDKPVALICRSGNRSAHAQKVLLKAGFTATTNIEGGMIAWQRAGLPVISGMASR